MTNQTIEQISHIGIVPVIVIDEAGKAAPPAGALVTGDLPAAEVIFRIVAGEGAIRRIATEVPEMLVGADTVLTTGQADRTIATGAQFIVSPGFNPAVTRYVVDRGVLMIPGTTSPGEMKQTIGVGLDAMKSFPAEQNGDVAKLKAPTGPYTNLCWMPTRNVNTKNLIGYLSFDKIMACGNIRMIKKDLIEGERWDKIIRICREAVQTMLGSKLRHIGISCDNEAEAEKTAEIFCALFQLPCKPGNFPVLVGSVMEYMKNPYPGKHGHVTIDTNSVEQAIYHLNLRDVTFGETARKTDGVGKAKAIYLDGEVGDFALQLTQK